MAEHRVYSVGAGGWVTRADGAVLLVRMTYGPAQGRLMIPGGHVDRGENIAAAALREVREETGVIATVRGLLMVRQRHEPDEHNLYFVFLLTPTGGAESPQLEEVSELVWLTPEAMLARDDIQPIAAELAAAWQQSPGCVLAGRDLAWQNPATYALWAGSLSQPPSGT